MRIVKVRVVGLIACGAQVAGAHLGSQRFILIRMYSMHIRLELHQGASLKIVLALQDLRVPKKEPASLVGIARREQGSWLRLVLLQLIRIDHFFRLRRVVVRTLVANGGRYHPHFGDLLPRLLRGAGGEWCRVRRKGTNLRAVLLRLHELLARLRSVDGAIHSSILDSEKASTTLARLALCLDLLHDDLLLLAVCFSFIN